MFPTFLIEILVVLLVVGLILWVVQQFPIDAMIAKMIRIVVVVLVAIWLIYTVMGMVGGGHGWFVR